MNMTTFTITREKHLDHLVKVVPFIVLAYGIHSYILMQMKGPFGEEMLMLMAGLLVVMIGGFVTYDVKHHAVLHEDRIEIQFLGLKQVIPFSEILTVQVFRPEDNFSTIFIHGRHQKARLYFVDDADKIKKWIEERKLQNPSMAA